MDNVQLRPTRKLVIPNDQCTKKIFGMTLEEYKRRFNAPEGFKILEKNTEKHGKIFTRIKITADPAVIAADPSITEILGQFDCDVADVCISEWNAGNRCITYSTIYRTLTGKVGESEANPSKIQLTAIKRSLKKLMNVKLDISLNSACTFFKTDDGKTIEIANYIIPAKFVECTISGQKMTTVELTDESPILTVAALKNNQVIFYDTEWLNVPNQNNTPLNIALVCHASRYGDKSASETNVARNNFRRRVDEMPHCRSRQQEKASSSRIHQKFF